MLLIHNHAPSCAIAGIRSQSWEMTIISVGPKISSAIFFVTKWVYVNVILHILLLSLVSQISNICSITRQVIKTCYIHFLPFLKILHVYLTLVMCCNIYQRWILYVSKGTQCAHIYTSLNPHLT